MRKPTLRLFVYGTLKRGFPNHRRYCWGARSIEPAFTVGRLYELPAGYPALVIPEGNILARGTANPVADAAAQDRFGGHPALTLGDRGDEPSRERRRDPETAPSGWSRVWGEALTFDDPAERLKVMDCLEDFEPGRPGLYGRVLACVTLEDSAKPATAWLYVMKDPGPGARRLPAGRWPGRSGPSVDLSQLRTSAPGS